MLHALQVVRGDGTEQELDVAREGGLGADGVEAGVGCEVLDIGLVEPVEEALLAEGVAAAGDTRMR